MTKFQKGDKVINVNSNEQGVITLVLAGGRGRQLYKVKYGSEEKDTLESNIIPDTDIDDPFECCKRGLFSSYIDFSRINTTYKINNTSNNTISSLKASKTIFKPYQFKPLLKYLNSNNRRLLIADEVGLGKTIEAGHILLELSARKELKNALIICPKMLHIKWKTELKDKFNFNFKIFESKKDFANELSYGPIKGIVSYETIRSSIDDKDNEQNSVLQKIIEDKINFDIIICDEAHRMRNSNTQTFKGAEKIFKDNAKSIIFLTATPIMISEANLFNLLNLMDEKQFGNSSIFSSYLSVNKPFINAIIQLNNNVSFQTIKEDLSQAEIKIQFPNNVNITRVDQWYQSVPLYNKIIEDLSTKEDNNESRVQLQFDLSSMSTINNIFTRTRKRDVTTDWSQAVRVPKTVKVTLHSEEREQFDDVIEQYYQDYVYVDEYGEEKLLKGHSLGLIQKKRMVASSVFAYLNDAEDLNNGVDKFLKYQDAKFEELIKIINEVVVTNNKKLIVFALFRNTLKYLEIRLKKQNFNAAIIHGDIKDRNSVIENFRNNPDVNILLSSEVGSEGLDLQFCDALVNYDLPWNPMVVEQRIGRIDRFGQKSQVVNLYNLIVEDSIQEEIYDRLLDRIGIFRSSIGDLEAILEKDNGAITLKEELIRLEKKFYCTNLSKEEREKKIESIERAILREKRHLEEISTGLTDTITNDVYFKNEIERIQTNYRYITEKEILNYLNSIIEVHLSTCSIVKIDDNYFKFLIPQSDNKILINFLYKYIPVDNYDNELLFKEFIERIRGVSEFKFSLNQEIAFNDRSVIYINAYHPIILAARSYFDEYKNNNKAFQFGISINNFRDIDRIVKGDYLLAIYCFNYSKSWLNSFKEFELLVPILYNIDKDVFIKDSDISERFLGECQLFASINQTPLILDENIIDEYRFNLAEYINKVHIDFINDKKMRLDTSKSMEMQQTEEYYNNRINNIEERINDYEDKIKYTLDNKEKSNLIKILPATRGQLQSMIDDRDKALKTIKESKIISKEPKIVSISQIKVY